MASCRSSLHSAASLFVAYSYNEGDPSSVAPNLEAKLRWELWEFGEGGKKSPRCKGWSIAFICGAI